MQQYDPKEVDRVLHSRLGSSWGSSNKDGKNKTPSSTSSGVSGDNKKDSGCELHRLISAVRRSSQHSSYYVVEGQDQKWEAVRCRAEAFPNEVMVWDRRGRTVLIAAVAAQAPLPVLRVILRHSAKFGLETARDKTGLTALLVALESDSPRATIELLLSKNGHQQLITSNHQGTLPLHSVLARFHRPDLTLHHYSDRTMLRGGEPGHIEDLIELFLRIGSPEKQCLAENNIGLTPLHVALENKMPCHIIRRLVEACPKAVSHQVCGYTPLVAAIREDASLATIEYLISVAPETTQTRDIEGKFPLRRCIDRRNHNKKLITMLCTCSEAVTTVDIFGRNLMQLLLEQWTTSTGLVDPDIVELFLSVAPDVARDSKWSNRVGGDVCMSPMRLCYAPFKEALDSMDHPRERRRQEAARLSKAWWKIMQHIMGAMREFESCLRAAVMCDAPFYIVERLLKENPGCLRLRDSAGQYPLHWIFRRHRVEDRTRLVLKILDTAPEIARIPDVDGRLPLHLAIERGGFSAALLSRIIHAHPVALTVLDRRYGLRPYQVAATIRGQCSDTEQLDVIFTLVQAAPEVLSSRFSNTTP